MTRFQHARDNILNVEERAKSARKCVLLLSAKEGVRPRDRWRPGDGLKFDKESGFARAINYAPSEGTLQWLRDMVSRYVT